MRVLHVGSGFRPWRRGGLVAYIEDLMAEQVRRGHEVSYFFSGRQYPFAARPRLRRWERDGVGMYEVVNSPLFDHGRQPEAELSEPRVEAMLDRVLAERRPDVVHLQELAGLPSSVIELAREAGVPTVLTLQDYFLMCPTFRLFDKDERVCLRREVGEDCAANVAADPRDPGVLIEATIRHDLVHLPGAGRLGRERIDRRIAPKAQALARRAAARRGDARPPSPPAFQRRRDVNVQRMNRVDRVVAMSNRVAEIHSYLGVDGDRLRTVQLTLDHIARLRPRRAVRGEPLTFGTLAGLESTAKGANVLRDAVLALREGPAAGRFRLLAFGYHDSEAAADIAGLPEVELRGLYRPEDLDDMLEEVDVGIVPSVWEEAYGYVGPELLAKGIPVIGNEIGGIPDYVRDGETGWLNRSCGGRELADIMSHLVERPEEVDELAARVRANRTEIVKPMSAHGAEIDEIYAELVG